MRQTWRARWADGEREYEYRFTSLKSRTIARIDLNLKLVDLGYPIPQGASLEETDPIPVERRLEWMYPTMQQEKER